MFRNAEIDYLLEDSDIKEQVKKLYLDTICEGIPDKHRLSYRFSFRTFVMGFVYEVHECEKDKRAKVFEEHFSKIEELALELSKVQKDIDDVCAFIKVDYLKGIFEEASQNRDLFLHTIRYFPQRLKKGRDAITKEYKIDDDVSYKELFEDLVLSDCKELQEDMEGMLYDHGSRKILEILGEDEKFLEVWAKQKEEERKYKEELFKNN